MSRLVLTDEFPYEKGVCLGPVKGLGRFKIKFDGTYEAGWTDDEICLRLPSRVEIKGGINLTDGFDDTEKIIRTTDMRHSVCEFFFRWLQKRTERLPPHVTSPPSKKPSSSDGTTFICLGRTIESLMAACYTNQDMKLLATRFDGTVYLLVLLEREVNGFKEYDMDESFYRGINFMNLLTHQRPQGEFHYRERSMVVFQRSFGEHILIFASKVDAISDSNQIVDICLRRVDSVSQLGAVSLLKMWLTAELNSSGKICVGYRDEEGLLTGVQVFKPQEIIHVTENKLRYQFRPNPCPIPRCNKTLKTFLDFFAENVTEDDISVVYELKRNMENPTEFTFKRSESEEAFIPEWYSLVT